MSRRSCCTSLILLNTAASTALTVCRKAEKNFLWRTCYVYSLTKILKQTTEFIVESESGWTCGVRRRVTVHKLDGSTIRTTAATRHRPTSVSNINNRRASSREIHNPRWYSAYAKPVAEFIAEVAAVSLQRVVLGYGPP